MTASRTAAESAMLPPGADVRDRRMPGTCWPEQVCTSPTADVFNGMARGQSQDEPCVTAAEVSVQKYCSMQMPNDGYTVQVHLYRMLQLSGSRCGYYRERVNVDAREQHACRQSRAGQRPATVAGLFYAGQV